MLSLHVRLEFSPPCLLSFSLQIHVLLTLLSFVPTLIPFLASRLLLLLFVLLLLCILVLWLLLVFILRRVSWRLLFGRRFLLLSFLVGLCSVIV